MGIMDSLMPASGVAVPQPYQLTHDAGADRGAYGGTQSLGQYNLGGQNMGEYAGLTQAGVNNPYANMYQQGAGMAGGMGTQAGQGAFGAGGQLLGAASGLLPDVQALISMGFDPQNALYSRTQQQVQDQNAARAQQSGVGGTPYAQGVQNQANQNFNIDWQNNQLQRGVMGAQGAGGLLGSAGAGMQQGAGMQAGGIQEFLAGQALPYQTFQGINQNQLGLLNQAGQYGNQAAQIPQMQIQDYLAYLHQSNQNNNSQISAQQLALQKANSQFQQGQQLGQDVGQGLGSAAGMMPNPFAGSFGGNPAAYGGMNQTGLPGNALAALAA